MCERVDIVPYDVSWPERFAAERAVLRAVFAGAGVEIEHVGSTAVPGLGAKPTVDIMAGVSSLAVVEQLFAALEREGYRYVQAHEATLPERRYFRKPCLGPSVFHLHCVVEGSPFWVRQLAFRDYLRTHRDAAVAYEQLKLALAAGLSRSDYTEAKGPFIEAILAAALNDPSLLRRPAAIEAILDDTAALSFDRASDAAAGALLAVLASSKPGGRLLELGTGTGHGTAWLLSGMDPASTLDTVDNDAGPVAVAQRHLGRDPRVRFHVTDGAAFLLEAAGSFDVIYADAWPGKFSHLDEALALLAPGGFYVIDDLLPQPNWPAGHAAKIPPLVADLERRPEFSTTRLDWASGLMLVRRQAV